MVGRTSLVLQGVAISAAESDRPETKASSPQRDELASALTEALRPNDPSSQLATLLDEYLAELQAGRQLNRQQLLAEHPELAAQLEQCLSGIEFIHQASTPRLVAGAPTQLGDFRIVREVGRGGMGGRLRSRTNLVEASSRLESAALRSGRRQ